MIALFDRFDYPADTSQYNIEEDEEQMDDANAIDSEEEERGAHPVDETNR